MKHLHGKSAELFYDLRHAELFMVLKEMYLKKELIELTTTVYTRLRDSKKLKLVGGLEYLSTLPDMCPSSENVVYYLSILKEKAALRNLLKVCASSIDRIRKSEEDVEDLMMGVQCELDMVSRFALPKTTKNPLKIWTAASIMAYEPPEHHQLIGDNEICMGYEGVTVLAGPGSSGKSLAVSSLILAAARGEGTWLGRKVHRKFKILILQAENGARRIKKEVAAMKQNHPELELDSFIYISDPPEGGLPFHRAEFRARVREEILSIKPDLIVLDPWSQVATEDAAKEVIDKLGEIRSCFPSGDDCPGLLIIAHTKKPRPEDVRKGRGLVFMVSGSVALPNTARCVYVLLPWSDDPEDNRVYFCTPKLNNGEMYPATVWRRRLGTFFEHDDKTNPKEFGRSEDEREKITEEHLQACFEKTPELKSGDIVKRLCKISGAGESTCWRAIGEDGYLRPLIMRNGFGKWKLKEVAE
jgi:hypothetical protein